MTAPLRDVVCECGHSQQKHAQTSGCYECHCHFTRSGVLHTALAALHAKVEEIAERSSYSIDPREAFEEAIHRARAALSGESR